jgi:hypothetical protein
MALAQSFHNHRGAVRRQQALDLIGRVLGSRLWELGRPVVIET